MKNKLSIMLCVYNGDSFLRESIESIAPFAYEIIIVEGSWDPDKPHRSTDNTLNIISDMETIYPNKIKLIYFEPKNEHTLDLNNGYKPIMFGNELKARELAASYMTGDWCFLVDSDEIYKEDDLIKLDNYLVTFKEIDIPFVFDIEAFVFFFDYNFGVDHESFTRISRITEIPPYINNLSHVRPKDGSIVFYERIPDDIIRMYHYSFIDPNRVKLKLDFYKFNSSYWYNEIFKKIRENGSYTSGIDYYASEKEGCFPEGKRAKNFKKFEYGHPQKITTKLGNII